MGMGSESEANLPAGGWRLDYGLLLLGRCCCWCFWVLGFFVLILSAGLLVLVLSMFMFAVCCCQPVGVGHPVGVGVGVRVL